MIPNKSLIVWEAARFSLRSDACPGTLPFLAILLLSTEAAYITDSAMINATSPTSDNFKSSRVIARHATSNWRSCLYLFRMQKSLGDVVPIIAACNVALHKRKEAADFLCRLRSICLYHRLSPFPWHTRWGSLRSCVCTLSVVTQSGPPGSPPLLSLLAADSKKHPFGVHESSFLDVMKFPNSMHSFLHPFPFCFLLASILFLWLTALSQGH